MFAPVAIGLIGLTALRERPFLFMILATGLVALSGFLP